jgi:hypothetical protein
VIIPLGQFGRSRPARRAATAGTDRPMIGLPA